MGTVKTIDVSPDLTKVLVTVETMREAEPLLTDKTIFWVVKPQLFAGNVTGLDTLLSGSYIGMLPSTEKGEPQRHFVGKEDPPILQAVGPGHDLQAARPSGSARSASARRSSIRDIEVGTVLGWDLGDLARQRHDPRLRARAVRPVRARRFAVLECVRPLGQARRRRHQGPDRIAAGRCCWAASPSRPTADRKRAGRASRPASFRSMPASSCARSAGFGHQLQLLSYFPGSVAGLDVGADVTLHGLKIGEVTERRPGLRSAEATASWCRCTIASRPIASATSRPPQGRRAGNARRRDGQARLPRHPAVAEPDHRAEGHRPRAHPRCTAGGARSATATSSSSRRARPAASTASPARPTSSCPRSTASTSTRIGKSLVGAANGARRHDQRPAAQEDAGVAREGDGRRPGHRPQARHRRRRRR